MKIWRLSEAERTSDPALAAAMRRGLTWYGLLANGAGGVFVLVFLIYLGPSRITQAEVDALVDRSIPAFIAFMLVALPFGRWWAAMQPFRPIAQWLRAERSASVEERTVVLRYPLVWARRSAVVWAAGAIGFAALNSSLG